MVGAMGQAICRGSTPLMAVGAILLGLQWLAPAPADAQEEADAPGKRAPGIEEVIVTARRVEESLQDTPVSVSAFGQNELENIGFSDVSDVGRYTPNLDIRKSIGGTDDVNISMRGMFVGDPQLGLDPTVGVYLDGVYIARNVGMAFDIVDVERIEVLRGPQGTLFGRNTIGGAINIVSQKPRGELAFRQQVTYGSRGRQRFHTTLDTPSVGNFSAKLSFLKTDFDGMVKSMHTGKDLGWRQSSGARLALMWAPSDSFSVDYSVDITRIDTSPNFTQVTHTRPFFADPDGEFYGGAYYDRLREIASADRRGDVPIVGQTTTSDIDGHALTLQWQALPALTVKSITGYREMDISDAREFATIRAPDDGSLCRSPNPGDYDFATGTCFNPVPAGQLASMIGQPRVATQQRQWTQEFQLLGGLFDQRLRYAAGLYYFEEQGRSKESTQVVVGAPLAAQAFAEAVGLPEDAVVPQNRGNSLFIVLPDSGLDTDNQAYALYGDFTYTLLPRLEATLGFRYSIDERTSEKTDSFRRVIQTVAASEEWDNFNPSLTVNYRWTDQVSTYAKVATGYRAGGFNQRVSTVEAFKTPFNEENVISYEIGWKTDLFDRSLRFNGSVFYAEYTDRQVTSVVSDEEGVDNDIINAGESVHAGFELETVWLPFTGMRVMASYAYLDIDVREFITERLDPATAMPTNPGVAEDVSDDVTTSFAPENSGSLILDYQFDPWRWGQLSLRADAVYTDEAETGNAQIDIFDTLNAHTLVNARVTLSEIPAPVAGNLRIAAWGKNLTNREYRELGTDFGVLGISAHRFGELRSYGLDLIYEFNR